MNLATVRTGIKSVLTGKGFHVYATEETAALMPAAVILWPKLIDYQHVTYGNQTRTRIDIAVLLAVGVQAGEDKAVDQLDALVSTDAADGVIAALKGLAHTSVVSASNFRSVEIAGATGLGVDLNLQLVR